MSYYPQQSGFRLLNAVNNRYNTNNNGYALNDGGGGGGGDPPSQPTQQPQEPPPKKRKKKKKIKRVVPASFEVPIWGTFHVNSSRFYIGVYAIRPIICIIIIIIMWAYRKIPTLPDAWYRYCALYYIAMLPFYIVNLMFPLNIMVNALYTGYSLLNTGVFAAQSWLLFLFIYDYWRCAVGALPSICKNTFWTDLVVAVLTLIIWLSGLRSTVYMWNVAFRTSGVSRPSLIEYTADI
jgi:hypothetical protein